MLPCVHDVGLHIVHAAVPIAKSVLEAQALGRPLIESAAVVRAGESTLPGCGLAAVVVRVTAPNVSAHAKTVVRKARCLITFISP
jgi:hypothetical protein